MSIELGRIGIWRHSSGLTPEVVAEVEALGYGAIWVGGSPGGDLGPGTLAHPEPIRPITRPLLPT